MLHRPPGKNLGTRNSDEARHPMIPSECPLKNMAGVTERIYEGVLGTDLAQCVRNSKVLVVGAGGIGCELLKNLVLAGFKDVQVIDLDTIDVSNLNRQFLFQKRHVGKSKAKVARESVLAFNPDVRIKAYHDNITSSDYGIDFFRQFDLVMNALDNRAARNHVNRMCLAADVPLVESGTAGYLGQTTVIKKGVTECYECQPKPTQKTYPGCTIRNTPSEPIHCIVWAKHLFNQLFGEADADEEVSPDTEDPEAVGEAGERAAQAATNKQSTGEIERTSTRAWAEQVGYNPVKIFNKLFNEDIKYLLSMDKLWEKRRPPVPLLWDQLPADGEIGSSITNGLQDQRVWTVEESASMFSRSVEMLKKNLEERKDDLVWDKDDLASMDFVTSATNIRANIFGIPMKSRFDVKAMAGNIIPAIATTNAVIAGLIVMQGLNVLSNNFNKCKTIYLNRRPNPMKKMLVPCALDPPNPKCYVCAAKPEVTVHLDTTKVTVKTLEDKVLKEHFGMVAPDVEIDDGKGTILISSEEGETEENASKTLNQFNICNGSRLKADDFLQNYELVLNIRHSEDLEPEKEFEVRGSVPEPKPLSPVAHTSREEPANDTTSDVVEIDPTPVARKTTMEVDGPPSRKRKFVEEDATAESAPPGRKAARPETEPHDDDVIVL